MKKRLLGILMAILMVQALLTISVAAAENPSGSITPDYTWYGDGTAKEYTISDVDDLLGFANIVNGTANKTNKIPKDSFAGKTVYLDSDIDLSGIAWTPIGASMYNHAPTDPKTKQFEGTFDGRNHTITGLISPTGTYIPLAEDVGPSKEYSFGLFGYAYGANIRNVKLAAVDISCQNVTLLDKREAAGSGVAALVGFYVPKSNSPSVIENCHVLGGSVTASNNMGGLIGFMRVLGKYNIVDVTIKNCSNAANVTTLAREAGGILGLEEHTVNETISNVGCLKFINCENKGKITAENGSADCAVAGGILGQDHSGESYRSLQIVFDSCTNSGAIVVNGTGVTEVHAAGIGNTFYTAGPWLVAKNCKNTGNVTVSGEGNASNSFAGAIFGLAPYATLENCTNSGTIQNRIKTSIPDPMIGSVAHRLFLNEMPGDIIANKDYSTFILNGGTTPPPEAVKNDGVPEAVYNYPVRGSNIFGGWYEDSSFTEGPLSSLPDSGTVYAKWTHTSHCLCGDITLPSHTHVTPTPTWSAWDGNSDISYTNDTAYIYLSDDTSVSSALTVGEGQTLNLCLNGHELKNSTGNGNFIQINGGTLNLCDCAGGGTVNGAVTNAGNFNMSGGTVNGAVTNAGDFNMSGGTVNGAVTNAGDFNMSGGTLNGAVTNAGNFNMSGGTVTNNAADGYAVHNIPGDAVITISCGTIRAPEGIAVALDQPNSGSLWLSGAPVLKGKEVDISLNTNRIVLDAPLTCDDPYTVKSVVNSSSAIVFTNGWSTHMNGKDPSAYFIAYADTITPVKQLILSNGELCLAEKHQIAVTLAENGSIQADKESATVGETVTLTPTPDAKFAVDTIEVFRTGEESPTVTVIDNKFTMPDYPVTVRVTFKQVIFDDIALVKLHYGDSTETVRLNIHASPSAKTVEGMVFVGWYDDANLTQRHDFSKPLENNANLYARYITPPKRNRVSFTADGRLIAIVLYRPSQTELTFIPKVPQKEGYVGTWEAYTLNGRDFVVRAVYTKE